MRTEHINSIIVERVNSAERNPIITVNCNKGKEDALERQNCLEQKLTDEIL